MCFASHTHFRLSAFDDQIPAQSHTWAAFRLMTALTQWADANADEDAATTSWITECVGKYLVELDEHVQPVGLNITMGWSYFRWQEAVSVAAWSIEHPHMTWNTSMVSRIARLGLLLSKTGFNWGDFLSNPSNVMWNRSHPDPSHPSSMSTHGVNVGQALQAPVWQYRITGDSTYLANITAMVGNVWHYHGQASGMYSAEDNLAGLDPSKGTETCATNEALLSLYVAGGCVPTSAAAGDTLPLLDRAEKIVYNALPGWVIEKCVCVCDKSNMRHVALAAP